VLPDKAIDVIDEAGARVRLKSMTQAAGPEGDRRRDRSGSTIEKDEAVAARTSRRPRASATRPMKLKKKREIHASRVAGGEQEVGGVVDEEVIAEVVSKMTGIPLSALEKDEAARLLSWRTSCTSGHQPGRGDQGDREGDPPRRARA
jgi:ATP-dependent Clp protease ATP-binding subunit ClpC